MAAERSLPLARERALILALVLGLSLAAWVVLVWQAGAMRGAGMGLTMGMSGLLFLGVWVVMMVATMFPAAANMILLFDGIAAGKRRRAQAFVPTWVFVAGYLLVWTVFGALAYALATLADRAAGQSMWLMTNASRIGGGVLIAAGL